MSEIMRSIRSTKFEHPSQLCEKFSAHFEILRNGIDSSRRTIGRRVIVFAHPLRLLSPQGLSHQSRVAWHKSLEDAINYAAFRLRGYVSEIQIFDRRNELQALVLIDQTGAEPAANASSLSLRAGRI
jgi:hypothetical protein